MKNSLIKAVNIFLNLYPDYQLVYIFLWSTRDNTATFKIKGKKGAKEVIDMIKVYL